MSKIKIDVDKHGRGAVIVDGKDISNIVKGVIVEIKPGKMPVVALDIKRHYTEIELTCEQFTVAQEAVPDGDDGLYLLFKPGRRKVIIKTEGC